jgi:holliday junction DNA helicase RuvA
MIGYLKGTVIEKRGVEVWLGVRDVGYRVRVGSRLSGNISVGDGVELYVHTAVREDALDLYGFLTLSELRLFELIISVSGIGPKIGLSIVGNQSVEGIEKAVREADVTFFQRIPGIGKKGAQRIIVDLKGKLPSLKELDLSGDGEAEDDVTQALMGFGFGRVEVLGVLKDLDGSLSESEKIRQGLKRLGRK